MYVSYLFIPLTSCYISFTNLTDMFIQVMLCQHSEFSFKQFSRCSIGLLSQSNIYNRNLMGCLLSVQSPIMFYFNICPALYNIWQYLTVLYSQLYSQVPL